ncbi:MAG: hypothetical protein JWR85_1522 [Marmoricola sp.]|nr:hypothetical protein [Marmoricola sp.]
MIDTDVFGAELVPSSLLAPLYEPLMVGRPAIISFQTVAELRFGAALCGWGQARTLKLESPINAAEVIQTGTDLIKTYVRLRTACHRAGHALAQREHDADRWIAATAVRLGIPLISNDRIFEGVPSLSIESVRTA